MEMRQHFVVLVAAFVLVHCCVAVFDETWDPAGKPNHDAQVNGSVQRFHRGSDEVLEDSEENRGTIGPLSFEFLKPPPNVERRSAGLPNIDRQNSEPILVRTLGFKIDKEKVALLEEDSRAAIFDLDDRKRKLMAYGSDYFEHLVVKRPDLAADWKYSAEELAQEEAVDPVLKQSIRFIKKHIYSIDVPNIYGKAKWLEKQVFDVKPHTDVCFYMALGSELLKVIRTGKARVRRGITHSTPVHRKYHDLDLLNLPMFAQ
ncbi:hypothetical protein PsorP6_008105 [Peronosclerospora sorghi]|uniref:Uncharacterized protein n=1 Tax=Peronosclerospora sorghi TaxID=230839 RepID=A0ACC0W952_9STRA|nr:hypothetical protein PsorP6_008105 [Peronosclerospora sorghi]